MAAAYVLLGVTDELPPDEVAVRIAVRLLSALHPSEEPWEAASTIVRIFGPSETGTAFPSLLCAHETANIVCEEWPRIVFDFRAYPASHVDER